MPGFLQGQEDEYMTKISLYYEATTAIMCYYY